MTNARSAWRTGVILLLAVAMQACAVDRTVRMTPPAAERKLEAGDEVVITLHDGRRFKAVVAQVTSTELVTRKNRYAWADVRHVSREELDVGGTIGANVVLYVVVSLVAALVFVEALEDGFRDGND